jgi:predicted metal-dependent hydrolase
MEKRFTYENIAFDYFLIQKKRKTLSVTVYPNQSVVVKAPLEAKAKQIDDFLARKFRWILKQQRYFSTFKPSAQKQYVSGESFRYLGRSYKMVVRQTPDAPRVSLQHGTLTVHSCFPKNRLITKKLLEEWYAQRAEKIFRERLNLCFEQFGGKKLPALKIQKVKSRWGSYSPKTHRILLNLDLVQARKSEIDYVVFHELCHMTHPHHDKTFYAHLESKCPNWKKLKTELELRLLSN